MEPGTTRTLNLLFDWAREGAVKDWSATAWGENGEVKVKHNDGIQTRHMPSSGLENREEETGEEDNEAVTFEDYVGAWQDTSVKPFFRGNVNVITPDGTWKL